MMYLSRLRLSRAPEVAALNALLDPDDAGPRTDAQHRLIWSLFADSPSARRDFLWRADGHGVFLVQSARPPGHSPFFDPPDIREHAPDLRSGDRLSFLLRANATRELRGPPRQRVDVVMNSLHGLPRDQRKAERMVRASQAARDWMDGQGVRAGFAAEQVDVQDYSTVSLPGAKGRKDARRFGILDLIGEISVTDPDAFLAKLAQGFGRAKSFGCGLMLIRRI